VVLCPAFVCLGRPGAGPWGLPFFHPGELDPGFNEQTAREKLQEIPMTGPPRRWRLRTLSASPAPGEYLLGAPVSGVISAGPICLPGAK